MYFLQPGMIFIAYSAINETPSDWGMSYQDIYLTAPTKEKINGWYIPQKNAKATILFFHGNTGNNSHRGESIKIFHEMGLNVFIIDYRGFGKSDGLPSELTMYEDAMLAWQYLVNIKQTKPEHIILFGRSLGGAVAIELATKVQSGAVIIESTFDSFRSIAEHLYPVLAHSVYLRYEFNNEKKIKKVNEPIMILHSQHDEIIPFKQGKRIFQAAHNPKQFLKLKGDHNYGFIKSQPKYGNELSRFINISLFN